MSLGIVVLITGHNHACFKCRFTLNRNCCWSIYKSMGIKVMTRHSCRACDVFILPLNLYFIVPNLRPERIIRKSMLIIVLTWCYGRNSLWKSGKWSSKLLKNWHHKRKWNYPMVVCDNQPSKLTCIQTHGCYSYNQLYTKCS